MFEVCYLSVELGERYTEPMLRVELLATRESAVVDKAPRTCVPGESFALVIGRYETVAIGGSFEGTRRAHTLILRGNGAFPLSEW